MFTWRKKKILYKRAKKSGLFDSTYYLAHNPDVKKVDIDPFDHYLTIGWRKGKNPSTSFSTSRYLELNPEVRDAGINPLIHYLETEMIQRRRIEETRSQSNGPRKQIEDALLRERVRAYQKEAPKKQKKMVVYTAVSNNYDVLKIPEVLSPEWDYVCFTDRRDIPGEHPWQIQHFDYIDHDNTRTCRYYKTHPHVYFQDYDYSIWIDAHILIKTDFLETYLNNFVESGDLFAAIPHPFRNCTYEEGRVCVKNRKDEVDVIKNQLNQYQKKGFPKHFGLIETMVLIRKHSDEHIQKINTEWWNEIQKGSKRDELSLMYVLWKNRITWTPLMEKGFSTRNHNGFKFYLHGLQHSKRDGQYTIPSFLPKEFAFGREPFWISNPDRFNLDTLTPLKSERIDIVICVHNALEFVKNCLDSLLPSLLPFHRLIIVDDGSGPETQDYLKNLSRGNTQITLLRHEEAIGYTKSANEGIRASVAPFVILLNSDTIVCENWALKLLQTATSGVNIGIVGPMSNAASWQSLPFIRDPITGGMAINEITAGKTIQEMDILCQQHGWFEHFPRMQLVNGFCYGIRRNVIDAIGLFDEDAFPKGFGEEDDYSTRALDAGFIHSIATHCYVFHAKTKSFGKAERLKLARPGGKIVRQRHGEKRIRRATKSMHFNPMLQQVRANVGAACRVFIPEDIRTRLDLPEGLIDPEVFSYPSASMELNADASEDWELTIFPNDLSLAHISLAELDANAAFVRRMKHETFSPPEHVLWFVPNYQNLLAGGIRTIFMVAEEFSRSWGTHNTFVVLKTTSKDHPKNDRLIKKLFKHLKYDLVYKTLESDPAKLPKSDIAFCSSWPTAYYLARYNRCRAKFYFMQDYETLFYPAGAVSGLIEETYRFGFYCIANSPGIAEQYRKFSDDVEHFIPGVDRSIYKPLDEEKTAPPWQLVFYGRPKNRRNAFALGIEVLKEVKNYLGDSVRIVSAGSEWESKEFGVEGVVENLGVLDSLESVADLYRNSHIGLIFMLTPHPSYQPLEYMASGCVTVTNENPSTRWLLKNNENAVLTSVLPADIARSVISILKDDSMRKKIVQGGLETVQRMDWAAAFEQIRKYVINPNKTGER